MIQKNIKKLGLALLALLIIYLFLLCLKVYFDNRSFRIETIKLEAKIEAMLKKHPNKTMLVQFFQNKDIIHSVSKKPDFLGGDVSPTTDKPAPVNTYWVIGITAVGPIGFGKNYAVFFDKKGKFLTYQSYKLVSPGLDF